MGKKENEQTELVVVKSPKWRDVPCIFIVLALLVGFVVIAIIDLSDYRRTKCFSSYFGDPRVMFFEPTVLGILAVSLLITLISSGAYYSIAALYTDKFILVSMAVQLAVSLGTSVFYLSQLKLMSGVFSVLWLVASAVLYWLIRSHIPAALIQLDITMRVAERNPSIIITSVLGAFFCAGWSILVGSVTLAGFGKAITQECSSKHQLRPEGEFLTLLAYVTLCNYLIAEVAKAVVRMSICYTYGWWSFLPQAELQQQSSHNGPDLSTNDEFPSIPVITWMGVLAALSYSLGSLCMSSLLLAACKVLAQVASAWSQALLLKAPRPNSQDVSAMLLAWVLSNCATYVDVILSQFNNYVIVFVSLDNESYLQAFKRAVCLIVNEGISAIVNDSLACGTLTFSSWCIGALSSLSTYIYMRFISGYPTEGVFFVCSFVMVVCVQVSSVLMLGISSGVQTLFVALATDPARVRRAHPYLCDLLAQSMQ